MKKTLLTTLLLSVIIFSAGAEKIIFSNAPDGYKEAPITGTAKIDANNGDITVTANNYWIVGEESASVAFYPEKSYVQSDNEYVNFHWTLNFAGNCSASSNNWDISNPNTSNNIEYSKNVYIGTVGSSGKTFSIECNKLIGTGTDKITKSFTINKIDNNSSGTTTPTITAFSVSHTSLPAGGGDVTLSWASSNSTRCIASASPYNAEWTGSVGTSGTKNNVSITQSTRFTLTCYNGPGATDPSVTNNNPYTSVLNTNPTNCPAIPAGITEMPIDTLEELTNTTTGNNPIVNPGNGGVNFELSKNKYVAIPFEAPGAGSVKVSGNFGFEIPPGTQTIPGGYRVTISQCRGDFDRPPVSYGCGKRALRTAIHWSIENNPSIAKCKLTPGGHYYLNIIHSSTPPSYTDSNCPSSQCGVLFAIN